MRKVICWGMCLMLIVTMAGIAYAEEGIMPCYTYVKNTRATLSISSGTATVLGNIQPSGNLKTSVIVRLQRESNSGSWTTISTWTDSNECGKSEAGGTKALTSGYNYRVYITGKVYNSSGIVLETVNTYSTTKTY